LAYLHNLAILEREEIGILATVIEPVVWATLVAPTEKRKKGIDAIQKMLSMLKRGLSRGPSKSAKSIGGKQDAATSKAVSLQIARLSRDPDVKGRVVYKKKDDMAESTQKDAINV